MILVPSRRSPPISVAPATSLPYQVPPPILATTLVSPVSRPRERVTLGADLSPVYASIFVAIASSVFTYPATPSRRSRSSAPGYAWRGHMMKCHLVRCWRFSLGGNHRYLTNPDFYPCVLLPCFGLRISQTDLMALLKLAHSHLPIGYCCSKRISWSLRGPPWWLSRTSTWPEPYGTLRRQELVSGPEPCSRRAVRGRAPGTG
jgi:hypothetical protein